MMQATATNSGSPFKFLITLVLVAIVLVIGYNIIASQAANMAAAVTKEVTTVDGVEVVVEDGGWSHRTREHAEDVETVNKCLKGDNFKRMFRQDENTIIRVCIIRETGEVIFQILNKRLGQLWEKTAFVKDELCNVDPVKVMKLINDWMTYHNYSPIKNIMKFVGIK